jgi:putative flippase GtrA
LKFAKYLTVQVLAYTLDLGMFLLLTRWAGAGPIVANVFSKSVAGAFAFFVHRHVTFDTAREHRDVGQAARYVSLLILNIPLAATILKLVLFLVHRDLIAKVVSDVIGVFLTYWISKAWVFSPPRKLHATEPPRP